MPQNLTVVPDDSEDEPALQNFTLPTNLTSIYKKQQRHTQLYWEIFLNSTQQQNNENFFKLLWFSVLGKTQLKERSRKKILRYFATLGNSGMAWVYLFCNALSLSSAIVGIAQGGIPAILKIINSGANFAWNYYDSAAGYIIMADCISHLEYIPAVINAFSSTQLLVLTTLAQTAAYIGLTTAAATAFTGFSFAFCMFFSYLIEVYEVNKCQKNINLINEKISNNLCQAEISELKNALLLEKYLKKAHERQAKAWLVCTIAMTTIAIVAFSAASGVTFGGLPAALLLVATIGVISGVIRQCWVNRINYRENLKYRIANKLDEKLETYKATNQNENLELEKLLFENPKKARELMEANEPYQKQKSFSLKERAHRFSRRLFPMRSKITADPFIPNPASLQR